MRRVESTMLGSAARALCVLAVFGFEARASESVRPNIVLFLVDDLGWNDTEVEFAPQRAPGNVRARTPNVKRLAETGVRFTQAYAYPVCSPSRTSLMTGQSSARHRVTQWTREKDADPSGQGLPVVSPPGWRRNGLQPGEPTVASLLRDSGYRTVHVGKAHFGARTTDGEKPENLGFEVSIAGHCAGAPGSYSGEDGFGRRHPGWAVPELEAYHGLPIHLTDALTVEANREVERAVRDGKPFFLYLAHYAVHTPLTPHAPHVAAYRERGFSEREANYASLVAGVDGSLGSLLAQCERLGVAANTIVIFVSDNGGLATNERGSLDLDGADPARRYNFPLREGKGNAYEGGIRVPQIVAFCRRDERAPAQRQFPIAAGATSDAPTILEDLFPTILDLAGAARSTLDLPRARIVDGRSIVPLLDPESEAGRVERAARGDRAILVHYPHVWGPRGKGYEPFTALRVGDHKLIWFPCSPRFELFDLANDLGESRDLAAANEDLVKFLRERMIAELAARDALYPVLASTGEEVRP
jgi:arylsulfatase A-like enzyme